MVSLNYFKYLAYCSVLFLPLISSQAAVNPSILQDSRHLPEVDGTFGFLYRTEDGIAHAAKGDANGVVQGRFSYTDPTGLKVNYNYNAGSRATPGYNYNDPGPSAKPQQPQSNYRPAPQPPQPSYRPAPQPSYRPEPQPSYRPEPQPIYRPEPRRAPVPLPPPPTQPQFRPQPKFSLDESPQDYRPSSSYRQPAYRPAPRYEQEPEYRPRSRPAHLCTDQNYDYQPQRRESNDIFDDSNFN